MRTRSLQLVEPDARIAIPGEIVGESARHEAADQLHRLQVGIELPGGELHLGQGLAGQRDRRGHAHAMAHGDARHAGDLAEVDLGERSGPDAAEEFPQIALQFVDVETGGRLGTREHQQRLG
jgi:hypothetical protein